MGDKVKFTTNKGKDQQGEVIDDEATLAKLDHRAVGIPMDERGRMPSAVCKKRGLINSNQSGKVVAILDLKGQLHYKKAKAIRKA